jgi:hypothetical protein
MKHATAQALDQLEPLLADIRERLILNRAAKPDIYPWPAWDQTA